MVVDGNEVDEEGKATDQGREERGTKQHLLDPFLAYMRCMYVRTINIATCTIVCLVATQSILDKIKHAVSMLCVLH